MIAPHSPGRDCERGALVLICNEICKKSARFGSLSAFLPERRSPSHCPLTAACEPGAGARATPHTPPTLRSPATSATSPAMLHLLLGSGFVVLALPALHPRHGTQLLQNGEEPEAACSKSCDTHAALGRLLSSSQCPQAEEMYSAMAAHDTRGGRGTFPFPHSFMSVGCNRAEDLVAFAQLFDRTNTYNGSDWVRSLLEVDSSLASNLDICDAVDAVASKDRADKWMSGWLAPVLNEQAAQSVAGQVQTQSHQKAQLMAPKTICAEAMPSNVRLLQSALEASPHLEGSLSIVGAAFGSSKEAGSTVEFPNCNSGVEWSGLDMAAGSPASSCPTAPVLMHSVDLYTRIHNVDRLDALFIDTEGHDPAVIDGAMDLFARQAVRYVEFEVHRDLPTSVWASTSLRNVTSALQTHGYNCFWMSKHGFLTELTECYHEAYDTQTLYWSNVACVHEEDTWAPVVRGFAKKGGLCEVWGDDK